MTAPDDRLLEEELPQPGRDRHRRLRIDIAVGALVLLGVVLFLRASTRDHHAKPAPAPSSTAVATPVGGFGTPPDSGSGLLAGVGPGVSSSGLPPRVSDDPSVCPSSYPCATTNYVPAGVRGAVHAVFPTARIRSCYTVHLTGHPDGLLWFRQVEAVVDGGQLVVRIQSPAPAGASVRGSGQVGTTTIYNAELGAYYVTTEFDWPGSVTGVLARLVADRRLIDD